MPQRRRVPATGCGPCDIARANSFRPTRAVRPGSPLLLDTSVYIDGLKQAGLPAGLAALLAESPIRHARVCLAELAFGYGRLDPGHPASHRNREALLDLFGRIPATGVVDLSPAGWIKAGALAGILSRTQGFAADHRRALLIDAAVFVAAQENELVLVSGNLRDMDLLLQIGGPARVLLYALPA